MNTETNILSLYEILSLVVTLLGVIATFLAVAVALWQTKFANRKKLKCQFIDTNEVVNQVNFEKKSYVIMSISNIGNKKVIVDNWGIKIKNGFVQILTFGLENDNFDKAVSVKTPYTLEPEESVSFFYAKDLFLMQLQKLIQMGEINANEKVQFHVRDSTSRIYKVRSKLCAQKYL